MQPLRRLSREGTDCRRGLHSRRAPDGASVISQGLRFGRITSPGMGRQKRCLRTSRSFPKITLVEFDLVFLEQRDEFILVRMSVMMLRLIGNVTRHLWQIRMAHGEGAVSCLPGKALLTGKRVMDPFR